MHSFIRNVDQKYKLNNYVVRLIPWTSYNLLQKFIKNIYINVGITGIIEIAN